MSLHTATKIPAITQIRGLPPLAVMALHAIKETLEVREGLHEPLDRFVSVRELANLILNDKDIIDYLGSGHTHTQLAGDHPWALLIDGSRSLTADWDIGSGRAILADTIKARSSENSLTLETDSGDGKAVLSESAVDYLTLSVRERDSEATYDPDITFSVETGPALKAHSSLTSVGDAIIFMVFDTSYLDGKRLRITWAGTKSGVAAPKAEFVIVDGSYDRCLDSDWSLENSADWWTKGNGLLSTLSTEYLTFPSKDFNSATIDLSGASLSQVTVAIHLRDSWIAYESYVELTKFEVTTPGDVVLKEVDFDLSPLTMEVTGTTGDYGTFGTVGSYGYRGTLTLGSTTDFELQNNTQIKLQNSLDHPDSYLHLTSLNRLIFGHSDVNFEGMTFNVPAAKNYLFQVNDVEIAEISSTGAEITTLTLSAIVHGTADYDAFLVSHGGIIKYRTGAEVLSDIGAGIGGGDMLKSVYDVLDDGTVDAAETIDGGNW